MGEGFLKEAEITQRQLHQQSLAHLTNLGTELGRHCTACRLVNKLGSVLKPLPSSQLVSVPPTQLISSEGLLCSLVKRHLRGTLVLHY